MKENSIEEDIKDIKKYISFTSKRENFSHDTDWNWNKDLANKIEHILSDYKRVLKENEELKRKNKTLEELLQGNLYELYKYYKELADTYQGNCIPVQKVKDKIEELNQYYKKEIHPSLYQWADITITEHYDEMIELLQELLEEGGENG